jgi:hypothetical protein
MMILSHFFGSQVLNVVYPKVAFWRYDQDVLMYIMNLTSLRRHITLFFSSCRKTLKTFSQSLILSYAMCLTRLNRELYQSLFETQL